MKTTMLSRLALSCILTTVFVASAFSQTEPYSVTIQNEYGAPLLYIGIDNPLKISVSDVAHESLDIHFSDDGTIERIEGDQYVARVTKPGRTYLEVYYNGDLIGKRTYDIKRIPDPLATFADSRGGNIDKATILGNPSVQTLLENYYGPGECKVVSYEATLIPYRKDPLVFFSSTESIPDALLRAIKDNDSGPSELFFENIKVHCVGDAAARTVGSLKFTIGN